MSSMDANMTQDELAGELKVPPRTLSQWRYLGRGPAYVKVGGRVRYRRSDVEAWMQDNRVETSRVVTA